MWTKNSRKTCLLKVDHPCHVFSVNPVVFGFFICFDWTLSLLFLNSTSSLVVPAVSCLPSFSNSRNQATNVVNSRKNKKKVCPDRRIVLSCPQPRKWRQQRNGKTFKTKTKWNRQQSRSWKLGSPRTDFLKINHMGWSMKTGSGIHWRGILVSNQSEYTWYV